MRWRQRSEPLGVNPSEQLFFPFCCQPSLQLKHGALSRCVSVWVSGVCVVCVWCVYMYMRVVCDCGVYLYFCVWCAMCMWCVCVCSMPVRVV